MLVALKENSNLIPKESHQRTLTYILYSKAAGPAKQAFVHSFALELGIFHYHV